MIAYGRDWNKTVAIMDRALNEYVIGGPKTTIPFHRRIVNHPRFLSGGYDTRFIETTPGLMGYRDVEPEALRLSRLVAEMVMYLNHPGDALKTIGFRQQFGNPNRLPLDVWFEGLTLDRELVFNDSNDKPHRMQILDMAPADPAGMSLVRYTLDDETFTYPVKIADATGAAAGTLEMADRDNPAHVSSPSTGDLWVMYVQPGDIVKKGEELYHHHEAGEGGPGHHGRHC